MASDLVYTDGVWDLLHPNHIDLMEEAASYGDRLLVGVVSDAMAMRYKRRPIMHERDGLWVVQALRVVSEAVMIDGPLDDGTVVQGIIDSYRPNVVCYGGSGHTAYYRPASELGIFKRLERRPGLSTSEVIERVMTRTPEELRSITAIGPGSVAPS